MTVVAGLELQVDAWSHQCCDVLEEVPWEFRKDGRMGQEELEVWVWRIGVGWITG
tara:strand:- start:308 stop:472 length:165 start_codon:yes stop_codon:yes gene_type:complete